MLIGKEVQVFKADVTEAHLVHLSQVVLQFAQGGEVGIRTTQRARVVLETVEGISSVTFIIVGYILTEYNLHRTGVWTGSNTGVL